MDKIHREADTLSHLSVAHQTGGKQAHRQLLTHSHILTHTHTHKHLLSYTHMLNSLAGFSPGQTVKWFVELQLHPACFSSCTL